METAPILEHESQTPPYILIVSTKYDPHVDFVVEKLTAKKIPFARFNTEDFPLDATLTINLTNKGAETTLQIPYNPQLNTTSVRSIWNRRPAPFTFPISFPPEVQAYAEQETRESLRGFWDIANCLWVNHPENNRRANLKITQLSIASQLGFNIPDTIVTNNPEEAVDFYNNHAGEVIVKALSRGIVDKGTSTLGQFTNIVTDQNLLHIHTIQYTPTLLQEYVKKDIEIRATVVGNEVFAAAIHSQEKETARIDWHRDALNLLHEPHILPPKTQQLCLDINHHFGLNFSAIDLIKRPDGEYVF